MFKKNSLAISVISVSISSSIFAGCTKVIEPEYVTEYYRPAYRQSPPEPVYSRLTWVHLPQQIRPKVRNDAPLIMPQVSFEFPKTNSVEAYESVAQTIGYKLALGAGVNQNILHIKVVGGIDEVLKEIDAQSGCVSSLDHDRRTLSVVGSGQEENVPAAKLPD